MAEKKVNKEVLKQEFLTTMAKLEKDKDVEKMIKDNRIPFRVGGIDYKVRKPNYAEQTEIETFRRKKYLELIDDDSMLFRKEWISKYKNKGIDIDKMEKDILKIQSEIDALLLRLAEIEDEKDVEKLKTEIFKLKDEQAGINIEKTDLLSYSIEDQLTLQVSSFYAFSVLEKLEKDEWIKPFKDYSEFIECKDSDLINQTIYYTQYLIYQLPI